MNDYYGFIYLWTNTHPDADKHSRYIGQHIGKTDDGYTGSGVIFVKRFYAKKYKGFWKRTILQYCNSIDELNKAEYKWINKYNAVLSEQFCNCRDGGLNGKHGPETLAKLSASLKGRIPHNKGKKGPKQSLKTLKKRVETRRGNVNKKYIQERELILKQVEADGYVKANDIPQIIGRGTSGVTQKHMTYLIENKILKIEHMYHNDTRYVPYDFNFSNLVVEYIANNQDVTIMDIVKWAETEFSAGKFKVKDTCKQLVKDNKIKWVRGYRKNLYSVV